MFWADWWCSDLSPLRSAAVGFSLKFWRQHTDSFFLHFWCNFFGFLFSLFPVLFCGLSPCVSCFTLHFPFLSFTAYTCVLLISSCEFKPYFALFRFVHVPCVSCGWCPVLLLVLLPVLQVFQWFLLQMSSHFKANVFYSLPVCIQVFFASLYFLSYTLWIIMNILRDWRHWRH